MSIQKIQTNLKIKTIVSFSTNPSNFVRVNNLSRGSDNTMELGFLVLELALLA
jgi:hypothetical protein